MKLLNLPIDCSIALKQEGRAQKFTCGHLHNHVHVCVYMQGTQAEACRNVLGFCFHFGFFLQEEGAPHFSLNVIHQFGFKKSCIKNNEAWDKSRKVFNASSDYF